MFKGFDNPLPRTKVRGYTRTSVFPQPVKPSSMSSCCGTAEAVPFHEDCVLTRTLKPDTYRSFAARLRSYPDTKPSSHADAKSYWYLAKHITPGLKRLRKKVA